MFNSLLVNFFLISYFYHWVHHDFHPSIGHSRPLICPDRPWIYLLNITQLTKQGWQHPWKRSSKINKQKKHVLTGLSGLRNFLVKIIVATRSKLSSKKHVLTGLSGLRNFLVTILELLRSLNCPNCYRIQHTKL